MVLRVDWLLFRQLLLLSFVILWKAAAQAFSFYAVFIYVLSYTTPRTMVPVRCVPVPLVWSRAYRVWYRAI